MPELRWTLLIIGVVFVAALALWERRRPHQAPRHTPRDGLDSRTEGKDSGWGPDADQGPRIVREPPLTLPEIRPREPTAPDVLPVVEIADDAPLPQMRPGRERLEDRGLERVAPPILKVAADSPVPTGIEPVRGRQHEPLIREPEEEALDAPEQHEQPGERGEPAQAARVAPQFAAEPQLLPTVPISGAPHDAANPAEPSVEWPPEEERRLISLRLVAPPQGRFSGRALRQALVAEGFVLGKFAIFHKPDAQNRALVSAASLTKPGTFDLETMDAQRFGGLNLFVVLPGPRSPLKAFDELLAAARVLNERLEGALQDERGGPLTPMRVAALRDSLEAEAKS